MGLKLLQTLVQLSEMARRSQETVEIKVCLERTGNDGSYLGMEKSGKLFLAPGGADITKDECEY